MQADDKPAMILELNISMEAPNITMPRSSDSKDAIEVDLGSLRLNNAVAWRNGDSMKRPEVSPGASIVHPPGGDFILLWMQESKNSPCLIQRSGSL